MKPTKKASQRELEFRSDIHKLQRLIIDALPIKWHWELDPPLPAAIPLLLKPPAIEESLQFNGCSCDPVGLDLDAMADGLLDPIDLDYLPRDPWELMEIRNRIEARHKTDSGIIAHDELAHLDPEDVELVRVDYDDPLREDHEPDALALLRHPLYVEAGLDDPLVRAQERRERHLRQWKRDQQEDDEHGVQISSVSVDQNAPPQANTVAGTFRNAVAVGVLFDLFLVDVLVSVFHLRANEHDGFALEMARFFLKLVEMSELLAELVVQLVDQVANTISTGSMEDMSQLLPSWIEHALVQSDIPHKSYRWSSILLTRLVKRYTQLAAEFFDVILFEANLVERSSEASLSTLLADMAERYSLQQSYYASQRSSKRCVALLHPSNPRVWPVTVKPIVPLLSHGEPMQLAAGAVVIEGLGNHQSSSRLTSLLSPLVLDGGKVLLPVNTESQNELVGTYEAMKGVYQFHSSSNQPFDSSFLLRVSDLSVSFTSLQHQGRYIKRLGADDVFMEAVDPERNEVGNETGQSLIVLWGTEDT